MNNGELMYQYDTQKILWMLSMVEFRNRDIRAVLGKGATVYPSYDAYENYFVDSHGVGLGGLSVIPCGVTNSLGNGSGTVYYKMPQVPVTHSNDGSNHSYTFADVWMPWQKIKLTDNLKLKEEIIFKNTRFFQVKVLLKTNNAFVKINNLNIEVI